MHKISPKVLVMFNDTGRIEGECAITKKVSDMHLEVSLPHNYKIDRKGKRVIDVIVLHEYCHYIYELGLTGKQRTESISVYVNNTTSRKVDEFRTWRHTKVLAKRLGMWNKIFYNCVKTYNYTGELTY